MSVQHSQKILVSALLCLCVAVDAGAVGTQPPATVQASGHVLLFKSPVEPILSEVPAGALATWRRFAERKPALLLFANNPLLAPPELSDRTERLNLLRNGTAEEVVRRGYLDDPDPAFLSPQAISVAIEAGVISELVFVQPTTVKIADVRLATFQQRAYDAGFLTAEEARALVLERGVIRGTVRGIPFRCVHPAALPKIAAPLLVHFDLGYFKDLYVNEVKTPVYQQLFQTAISVREAAYPQVLAVTLSYSNQEADFSLESRFMISSLADLLRRPLILDGEVPASWLLRANALAATTMLADDLAESFIHRAVETNPSDPAAHYAQALLLFERRRSAEAFAAVDRAVALDPGYALAYRQLAETAQDLGAFDKALELLAKAAVHFPDHAFVRFDQAEVLVRLGRGKDALPLLAELRKLPWNTTAHPGVLNRLDYLTTHATAQAAAAAAKAN